MAAKLTPAQIALKAKVERAVLAEVSRVGPAGISKADIIKPFLSEAGQSTLFRWVNSVLASGKPAKHLEKQVKKATEKRSASDPEPATGAAREAVGTLPAVVSVESLSSAPGGGAIPFIERLQDCLGHADELLKHARTEDGKLRNVKLLLAASEHVRRTLETAARIQDSLTQAKQVEMFHQAVFDVLREESPEMAERVLMRLKHLNAQWGNG